MMFKGAPGKPLLIRLRANNSLNQLILNVYYIYLSGCGVDYFNLVTLTASDVIMTQIGIHNKECSISKHVV